MKKKIHNNNFLVLIKTPWRVIKSLNIMRYSLVNRIIFLIHGVKFAKFPKIHGLLFIRNRGTIVIGKNVIINSGLLFSPIGGNNKTVLYAMPKGNIKIGNRVGISNACLFADCSITVEDDVLIGGGAQIYDTDFHPLVLSNRIMLENDKHVKKSPVCIRKGVFIC